MMPFWSGFAFPHQIRMTYTGALYCPSCEKAVVVAAGWLRSWTRVALRPQMLCTETRVRSADTSQTKGNFTSVVCLKFLSLLTVRSISFLFMVTLTPLVDLFASGFSEQRMYLLFCQPRPYSELSCEPGIRRPRDSFHPSTCFVL